MNFTNLLLLSGAMIGDVPAPSWHTDYSAAQSKGAAAGRPLAVFVAPGAAGHAQCCREGKLSDDAASLLASHYVCVYVDARDPANKSLVEAFGLSSGKGVILSDRRGVHQAFYHDGDLSSADLLKALRAGAGAASAADVAAAETPLVFTTANFDAEVLKSTQPVLVDFYADWCGPCQRMSPVVTALGAELRGVAKVGKINTDRAGAIASTYGVSAIPAFLIFQDGRVVDRVVGATSKEDLAARLKKAATR